MARKLITITLSMINLDIGDYKYETE